MLPEDMFERMTLLEDAVDTGLVYRAEIPNLPFLATTSASIMGQPSSRSIEDTVLFPEAIPPVSPTRNILRRRHKKMNSVITLIRPSLLDVINFKLFKRINDILKGLQMISTCPGIKVKVYQGTHTPIRSLDTLPIS